MTLQEVTPITGWMTIGIMMIAAMVGTFMLDAEIGRKYKIVSKVYKRHYIAMKVATGCFWFAFFVFETRHFL